MDKQFKTGRHHSTPMTLDEAARIESHFDAGRLDPELPGTMDLVNEAHRTHMKAYLWGSIDGAPQSRLRLRLMVITALAALVTIGGLVVSFVAGR